MAQDTYEDSLQTVIDERAATLNELLATNEELYPWDNTAAWEALTAEEKIEVFMTQDRAEKAVKAAEKAMTAYKAKKTKFYDNTKKSDMDTFRAEQAAALALKNDEWQDKEDYAIATGDWDLTDYKENWNK